jgi:hypothetical protein
VRRLLTALLLTTVMSACGSTTGTSIAPTPTPRIPAPAPSPTDLPPTPTSTPPAAAPTPLVRTGIFQLVAIGGSHASGLVQVTERNGSFVASVSVRGLAPGMASVHTVHIHAGTCANPYGGLHLTVLGLLRTGPTGAGMVTAPLAPFYVANGHYVIVYANTSAQVIVGCANLAALT